MSEQSGSIVVAIDAQLKYRLSEVELACSYIEADKADRTRSEYKKQWRYFQTWCDARELVALPALPQTVVLYLSVRAQQGRKNSTLSMALAAIRHEHIEHSLDSPHDHHLVKRALKGIRRKHGTRKTGKAPVLAQTLRKLVEVLPDTLSGARDRALLLIGFTGAFRRSELVSLEVSDFMLDDPEGLRVFLRKSKTDQEQLGREVAILPASSAGVDAAHALREWLERSGISEGLVFRSVDRHGNIGASLGDRDVARIVKRTAKAAGVTPDNLAAHSLRAGLATSAAKNNKNAASIMRQTGHTSVEMVTRYIRTATLFKDNATEGLL